MPVLVLGRVEAGHCLNAVVPDDSGARGHHGPEDESAEHESADHEGTQGAERRRSVVLRRAVMMAASGRVAADRIGLEPDGGTALTSSKHGRVAARAVPSGRAPRAVWVAALALTSLAAWFVVSGARALGRGHELVQALTTAQTRVVGPVLIVVVGAVFLAERRWPAVARPALARAHVVDAGYLVLFAGVAPFVTLLNTGFAIAVERHAQFLVLRRLPLVPQIAIVGMILIGMDATNWAAHVANHHSAPLWRFHALHHSQEDMSVFTTFRTHPLAHASYVPALLPALILGASGSLPGAAVIAYGCLVTLPHANLRWSFGPLGRVFVSPAYHRLHHARGPVIGDGAANFGFVLVCWDRLAGCAAFPTRAELATTGIGGRPVPIEQLGPASLVPRIMAAQLLQPFQIRAAMDRQP